MPLYRSGHASMTSEQVHLLPRSGAPDADALVCTACMTYVACLSQAYQIICQCLPHMNQQCKEPASVFNKRVTKQCQ